MGQNRVQPVFHELLSRSPDGSEWLAELCAMAASTRQKAVRAPSAVGALPRTNPRTPTGVIFDRPVPPPAAFLRWLLQHPKGMHVEDSTHFRARSEAAREWRHRLFSTDPRLVAKAQREGLANLAALGAEGSSHAWWAFEGFAHLDCCLVTDRCVVCVEGKRREAVAPSTPWFPARRQLWRQVEAAQQLARGKNFAVLLGVETDADGWAALGAAASHDRESYPHLTPDHRAELASRMRLPHTGVCGPMRASSIISHAVWL